jgi:hypothetical protein
MALSYDESAALTTDMAFRGRVKVACLRFAVSIMNEEDAVPAHLTRMKWAQNCMQNPDATAMQVQQPTVLDPNVQDQGATIPDNLLQGAVEATVAKFI